jgi:VWFA-related protein
MVPVTWLGWTPWATEVELAVVPLSVIVGWVVRMRLYCLVALVLILGLLPMPPAVAQSTPVDRPVRVTTLYSPLKYKRQNAPPSRNRAANGDDSRAQLDFTTGSVNAAFGRSKITYGTLYAGDDLDWFMVGFMVDGLRDDRTAMKDLGKHDWNDSFKVPIVPPLPELKPGGERQFEIDMSGKNGADGIPGAPGAYGDGSRGAIEKSNREWVDHIWPPLMLPSGPAAPKKPPQKKVVNPPVLIKAVPGHMYVVHVVNPQSDFYVLLHVDGLVRGDNCTISWKRVSGSASPAGGGVEAGTPNSGLKTAAPILAAQERHAVTASALTPEKPTLRAFGSSLNQLKWDPEKQAAVEINNANEKREGAATEDVVHVETRLVVSNVLVLDQKGRAVEGLAQNDFIVTEDGQPQQISHFTLGDGTNLGRSMVLIVDYSNSILPYIDMSTAAAKILVDQLGPKDRMAIVTDDVELLVDFTGDKTKLKETLDSVAAKTTSGHAGKSAQFSALLATLRESFNAEDVRPIVIFQTDGDQIAFMQPIDPSMLQNPRLSSKVVQFSLNDVNTAVEKSRRATIYTVIPGLRLIGLPPTEQARRADIIVSNDILARYHVRLKTNPNLFPPAPVSNPLGTSARNAAIRLEMQQAAAGVADITGGQTFFLEQPEQARDIYSRILSDMNRRYVIGYYPTNKTDDCKRRKVVIEVRNHPDYIVEGRKSYITSGSQ